MQNHYGITLLNAGEDWSPEQQMHISKYIYI